MKLPELVAPAGDFLTAQSAFEHGADAVYVGLDRYNLRAHSASFSVADMPALLAMARERGKRVYVVLNMMPDDATLHAIGGLLNELVTTEARPDAFVVSDPGVLLLCKRHCPEVAVHLSTQTGTFNSLDMKFWREQGICRVILPREMTLRQVTDMSASGICETEVFVHGAMCVSVSGRCLLGAHFDGRSANAGDCSQPCRLRYTIGAHAPDGTRLPKEFVVEESAEGSSILSSKDLCTLPILDKVVGTGVSALKIEGRNKGLNYVASVVSVYRQAMDAVASSPGSFQARPEWLSGLDQVDHRPYTTAFLGGELKLQAVFGSKTRSQLRVLGVVRALLPDRRAVIDVKNPFAPGEIVSVLPSDSTSAVQEILVQTVADLAGRTQERAVTNRLVVVQSDVVLRVGDLLRKGSVVT
jgi:U32 family peptidase